MAIEWLGPALTAIKHHETIKEMLRGGVTALFGKPTTVAFTGMEGSGKSVLFDHLMGKATKKGYKNAYDE